MLKIQNRGGAMLEAIDLGLFVGDFVKVTLRSKDWECIVGNDRELYAPFGKIYIDALPYLPFFGYEAIVDINKEIANRFNLKVGDRISTIADMDVEGSIDSDFTLLRDDGSFLNLIFLEKAYVAKVLRSESGEWERIL